MPSMDGSGLGANDRCKMELKKRAYRVIASDSALLQEASTVESGDSTPVAGCSGPVPMVWAPRAARGALMRAVHRRRRAPVEDAPLGRLHQYHGFCLPCWSSDAAVMTSVCILAAVLYRAMSMAPPV